ncbi:hypothetical protein QWJ07_05195 [Frankia sp. RB7]|nr:hypothetical protein [Frankia sp. RB7]
MNAATTPSSGRKIAFLSLVFVVSTGTATLIELLLWRSESLLAFVVPAVVYTLGSIRLLPWKTPVRKVFSFGILLGMFVPLISYTFGLSI